MSTEAASLHERTWATAAAKDKVRWWSRKKNPQRDPNSAIYVLPKKKFTEEDAICYSLKWAFALGRFPVQAMTLPPVPDDVREVMPADIAGWFDTNWHVAVLLMTDRYSLWGKIVRWFNYEQTMAWFVMPIAAHIGTAIAGGFGIIASESANLVACIVLPWYMVRDATLIPVLREGSYERWTPWMLGLLPFWVWPIFLYVNVYSLLD